MFRRRSAARSNPHCLAAASINRSITLMASAKPGPRVTPTGVGIGQHGADAQADGGDRVDATLQMGILEGLQRTRAAAHVSADIRDAVDMQTEEASGRVERQRCVREMIPRLMIADEYFGAAGDPLHRPAATFRGPGDQRLLGIGEVFGAEAAADIGAMKRNRSGGTFSTRAMASRLPCRLWLETCAINCSAVVS